ncbi:heterokaryon incompatibility protein-domain-containing protein [Xylariaceae sp. FL1019]|nr:heterokaryon incompatibility protein-domain-containing protein [Xylariaceae sp. FL1019]
MGSSNDYVFEPIDTAHPRIRLLSIQPGSGPLHCTMKFAEPNSKPEYEALSYCWGSPIKSKQIIVNDATFQVTDNLYAALKRMRQETKPRVLWIDAICIDQNSVPEKNTSVPMMKTIYQEARRVVIWLGEHDGRTKTAFASMEFAASKAHPIRPGTTAACDWKRVRRGDKPIFPLVGQIWDEVESYQASQALNSIFQRPWFTRTWTVQELVVASDVIVICGGFQIAWEVIRQAWRACRYGLTEDESLGFLINTRRDWQRSGHSGSVLDTMLQNWERRVTEEKDRIYGILGLSASSGHHYTPVTVDYGADTGMIFAELTRNHMVTTKTIYTLSFCSGCKESAWPGIPSWSLNCRPDPTREPGPQCSFGYTHGKRRMVANAGTYGLGTLKFSDNGRSLCLTGQELDTISTTSLTFPAMYALDSNRGFVANSHQSSLTNIGWAKAYNSAMDLWNAPEELRLPANQSLEEAVCLTVGAIRGRDGWDEGVQDEIRQAFGNFDSLAKTLSNNNYSRVTDFMSVFSGKGGDLSLFYENASAAAHRRAFVSDSGFIGLGPAEAQAGDHIVILQGGKAPMVVRESTQGRKLVGECYVHGVMDGSAFDETKAIDMWFE